MEDQPPVILVVLAFVVGFPLFWMAIVFAVSHFSGWAALARKFPATSPAVGQMFSWCSGKISFFSNYKNCINVTVSAQGLHLATMIFFRPGHNPIFIPWSAVHHHRRRQFMFATTTYLDINGGQSITLYGGRLADAIEKFAPANQT